MKVSDGWKIVEFPKICTISNHMFKREIWDKFTELTFLKLWNLPSETREFWQFQKMNEVNFPQISRINMWFLVNHMLSKTSPQRAHNGKNYTETNHSISTNLIYITPIIIVTEKIQYHKWHIFISYFHF